MEGKGTLVRLLLEDGQASCVVIEGKHLVQEAMNLHGLLPVATDAVGRTILGALIMASDLKEKEGTITLSVGGDGPLGKILVVADPGGKVKASVDNGQLYLPLHRNGRLDVGGAVGKNGTLSVVRDVGYGKPYVGRVALQTGEIAEDIAFYYALSQQQPCLWSLGVRLGADGIVLSAGGIAIFPLPGCTEDTIKKLEQGVPLYAELSNLLLDRVLTDCFPILFYGLSHQILGEQEVEYRCNCSRDRMERALISLGKKDLKELIEEDRKAELTCQFCQRHYHFTKSELKHLLSEATQG